MTFAEPLYAPLKSPAYVPYGKANDFPFGNASFPLVQGQFPVRHRRENPSKHRIDRAILARILVPDGQISRNSRLNSVISGNFQWRRVRTRLLTQPATRVSRRSFPVFGEVSSCPEVSGQ